MPPDEKENQNGHRVEQAEAVEAANASRQCQYRYLHSWTRRVGHFGPEPMIVQWAIVEIAKRNWPRDPYMRRFTRKPAFFTDYEHSPLPSARRPTAYRP